MITFLVVIVKSLCSAERLSLVLNGDIAVGSWFKILFHKKHYHHHRQSVVFYCRDTKDETRKKEEKSKSMELKVNEHRPKQEVRENNDATGITVFVTVVFHFCARFFGTSRPRSGTPRQMSLTAGEVAGKAAENRCSNSLEVEGVGDTRLGA